MSTSCIQETSATPTTPIALPGKMQQVTKSYKIDDVAHFMYEHKISTATMAGHGIGGKIALAAACYHMNHVTGYIGLDSTPMNQFYHEPYAELRESLDYLSTINLNRTYAAISNELKNSVFCPKWRNIFLNNLVKI